MRAAGVVVYRATHKRRPDPTCAPFVPQALRSVHYRGDFCPAGCSAIPPDRHEIAKLLHSLQLFPDRCHLVGVYALGQVPAVLALCEQPDTSSRVYLHGRPDPACRRLYERGLSVRARARCCPAPASNAMLSRGNWSCARHRHWPIAGPVALPEPVTALASLGSGSRNAPSSRRSRNCRSSSSEPRRLGRVDRKQLTGSERAKSGSAGGLRGGPRALCMKPRPYARSLGLDRVEEEERVTFSSRT